MTIYYIDPGNGNDANDGTSWAAAWKTIKSGATAVRIAPGDVIRISKSPDPVGIGNATWTNLSKTVTLATALTANIDLCNAAWTASANVTASLQTTNRKEGSNNVQFLVAATFTTGQIGYRNLGTTIDLSGYTRVSLRYRQSVALAANAIKLCLCSDASGDVIVDEFIIPAIETAQINASIPLTLAKGAALGSAIQSVALYALSDPGTPTIQFDNIIACNDFSLTSLISKNPNATGGEEAWYPIQSINDTTVLIDNGPATIATAGRGYYGTTETVATYRRECFRTATTTDCTVQDSGTAGSVIAFEGGCNTITGEQDGETFFDVGSGCGNGIDLSSRSYLTLNRLNMVRAAYGMYMNGTTYCTITANSFSGNGSHGVYCYYSSYNQLNLVNCCNNIGSGIAMDTTAVIGNTVVINNANNNLAKGLSTGNFYRNRVTITNACNNAASNLYLGASSHNNIIKCTNNKNSGAYAVEFLNTCKDNLIVGMTTSGNTSGAISHPSLANNYLLGCTLGEMIKVTGIVNFSDTRLQCQKHDGEYDFIYTDYGNIQSQDTVRHTATDMAWQLSPYHTNRSAGYPLTLPLAILAVNANAQVTVSCWFRRNNTGITGALFCRGLQIAGVDDDVMAVTTAPADIWEQLTISFTPTEAGVVEILALAYGGTAYSVYVDDIDYTQG
jgi:parallel beta-helix repeat protein